MYVSLELTEKNISGKV